MFTNRYILFQSFYQLLLFDSVISLIGFLTLLVVSITLLAKPDETPSRTVCGVLSVAAVFPTLLGPYFVAQLSTLRLLE